MNPILITNARVFDGHSPELREIDVLIADGRIAEFGEPRIRSAGAATLDLRGRVLMPGLIDAHIHAYLPEVDVSKGDRMPMTLVAHRARMMLEATLARGFTSVRDTGGADYGLHLAIERGW